MQPVSDKSRPLVSVVVTAYQQPDYLNQAVESVLAQTFADYELIVVDDCSGEDTVRQYRLPPQARLMCHSERRGAAAFTRNTGMKAARGKYVALMDQDDVWLPDKLQAQVESLESNPQAGLSFCHFTVVDESLRPLPNQRRPRRRVRDPLRKLIRGCFIRTPSMVLFRRDVLEEVGYSDESIVGSADRDLYMTVARKYPFVAVPQALVLYRMHPKQFHRRNSTMRVGKIKVMDKTLDWANRERPDLVSAVRRSYCRILRQIGRSEMLEEDNPEEAVRTLHRARKMWPWNVRTYGLLVRAICRSRKKARREEQRLAL